MIHGNRRSSRASGNTAWRMASGLGLLLVVGCASEPSGPEAEVDRRLGEYAKLIDEKIQDPARAEDLKARLDVINARFDAQTEVVRRKQSELKEAARQYATSEEELERILSDLRRETLALRGVLQDGHYELRGFVTEAEWEEIVNHRRKILGIF
jgi:chromosome segregation ATPase